MPCFLFNSFSKWWELSDQPQTRRRGGKTRTFRFYLPSLLLALLHWRESSSNSVERTIHYPQPFHNQSQLLYSFMLHVGRLTWFWQYGFDMYDLKVSICLAYILKVRGERGWREGERKGKRRRDVGRRERERGVMGHVYYVQTSNTIMECPGIKA